jgi:hypothetical protein
MHAFYFKLWLLPKNFGKCELIACKIIKCENIMSLEEPAKPAKSKLNWGRKAAF